MKAKKVFDGERCVWIRDRTKEKHNVGRYDVDFYAKRRWNYDSTSKTFEEAKSFAITILNISGVKAIRVVDNSTSDILFQK